MDTALKSILLMSGAGEINAVSPAITPTVGDDLVTDGGLENWTSPSNLTSWTESVAGTSTINQETTTIHGGSNAARFDIDASNSSAYFTQSVALAAKNWYRMTAWMRSNIGAPTIHMNSNNSNLGAQPRTLNTVYGQYFVTGRRTASPATIYVQNNAAASRSIYIDDISFKALTFASTHVLLGNHAKNGTYTCHPIVTAGTATGIIVEYLDDNNLVVIWTDGFIAVLESCIAGTWTKVKEGNISYGAGAALAVIVNGTTHELYYNGTQVSTDATIDNTGLGTQVRGFNTYDGNAVGLVTTSSDF